MKQRINVLVLNEKDTVGVAMDDLRAGDIGVYLLAGKKYEVNVVQDIPIYHKMALTAMLEGEHAYKYGQEIGRVTLDITAGQHVHSHNLISIREGVNE